MSQYDPNAGHNQQPPEGGGQVGPPQAPQGQGYGYPQQQAPAYYPVPVNTGTNGFAIASLICAFLCSPLGLIFGFIARGQIKKTGEQGDGLALAGLIVSGIFLALTVLYIILFVTVIGASIHSFNNIVNNFPSNFPSPST